MKHQEERIAVRLTTKQRQQIKKLVESGKFRNISEVIRAALTDFCTVKGEDFYASE